MGRLAGKAMRAYFRGWLAEVLSAWLDDKEDETGHCDEYGGELCLSSLSHRYLQSPGDPYSSRMNIS